MSDNVLPEEVERASAEYQPVETRYEMADGVVVVSNLFVKGGGDTYLPGDVAGSGTNWYV